jgi:hypothetical protein
MRLDRDSALFLGVFLVSGGALGGCVTNGTSGADDSADAATSGGGASGTMACSGASCVEQGACRPGQASAQFRKQTPPPDDLRPGARAWSSVTFDNCSGKTWSASSFALRPASPSDDATWGTGRVALPVDVPNGSSVTVPIEVTAPVAAGVYPFTWVVASDAVGALEERSPRVDVSVRYSADCTQPGPPARFQSWTVPQFAGTTAPVHASVTFANCSTVTWKTGDGFALGSQADQDNTTWGTKRVALPMEVPSQTQVTIPIDVTAPKTPGAYKFAWKIVQEGVQWIDEPTPVATITVLEPVDCGDKTTPLSRFVREDGVPGTVSPGDTVDASVTFGNCSKDVWSNAFHVGAAAPSNDGIWAAGRIALPFDVAPGYAITAPIHARAPGTGSYPWRWTIVQDGVGPIDEPSPQHDVTVRCVPSCGDHGCGGDGCGGSCGSCGAGMACDGAYCKEIPHVLSCSHVQWWNSPLTYGPYVSGSGWWDTDLAVSSSTPVQLRHDSLLYKWGVYGWGYMPEFIDQVTGEKFRFLHLRPADLWATSVGTIYPAGYVVGLSGGDTADTGLGPYSTGAHLCVQTLDLYRNCFPTGWDPCE